MRTSLRVFALLLLLAIFTPLLAQPPAPPSKTAPLLNPITPLGVQRGTTIDLTITGTNLTDPTGLWASFPAKVTIPTDNNNGKTPASLRVKLEVPKDAPLGFHSIRLATKGGMSNARLFCVDDLPQVMEAATNRDIKNAQVVAVPSVVVARMDAETTDYFKITVKANQRVSFDVLGRRLGSGFDPQITLLDTNGKELPDGFANDTPGLMTDCRMTYTFKNAGDVIVAIRDVTNRGGADFHYRLRIGDFPCATTPLPLSVKRGSKTKVGFAGPAVDGVAAVEVQAPTEIEVQSIQIAPKGTSGLHGWPVTLLLSDLDENLEKEPNNEVKQANRVTVPSAITGRFEQKEDVDHYVFKAEKGKRYTIEAHTTEHLSPTDVYMVLKNDKGAQVAASNPATPTGNRIELPAQAADGDFTLAVEHLHSWGGPDEVYRVTITVAEPSFSLTLNIDRWDVGAGNTVAVPIFATRAGYAGPIEVSVVGAKGLSGTVTIPAGPPKAPNQPSGTLQIKADESLTSGPVSFAIVGKATIDKKTVTVLATTRALLSTSMANLAVPPRAMFTQLGLAVTEKPPFSLALKFGSPNVSPGKTVDCTISVTRQAGFTGEVVVTFQGIPPGTKTEPAAIKIPGNQASAQVKLTPATNAKPLPYLISAVGATKHAGRDWSVPSGPTQLIVLKK